MLENNEPVTVGEAMETMSENDLAFIAAYNPQVFKTMCNMWSLEIELKKRRQTNQSLSRHIKYWEPENWFVYLRNKLQIWLFSKLLRMVSKK